MNLFENETNRIQKKNVLDIQDSSRRANAFDIPFGSNCVRLSGCEWLAVGIIFLALFYLGPMFWGRSERIEPELDYRLPYELSNDYWLYNRYCRWAWSRYETLVIGDSVIWGHYVSEHNTLPHYLNEITGRNQFANMGVDGIHPAALEGLLRYYGQAISGKNVILHLNPLWMSSSKHDLQIEKEFHFNHPRLVPQFVPKIPCYKVPYSKRISAIVERYVPFFSWASHLKIAYFENMDLPTWTIEHPYENPLKAVTLVLRTSGNHNQNERIWWAQRGIAKEDFPWVRLETSLQWNFFQRSIEILRKRGNRIFVLVGPFNEHMLKGESIETYRKMKIEIAAWLQRENIAYYIPPALPSEFYYDASHPLSEGYAMLAKQICENRPLDPAFSGPAAILPNRTETDDFSD